MIHLYCNLNFFNNNKLFTFKIADCAENSFHFLLHLIYFYLGLSIIMVMRKTMMKVKQVQCLKQSLHHSVFNLYKFYSFSYVMLFSLFLPFIQLIVFGPFVFNLFVCLFVLFLFYFCFVDTNYIK